MTAPNTEIEIVSPCAAWERALPEAKELAYRAARLALAGGGSWAVIAPPARVELSIILADDAEQRRLNRDWRGIDRPTNVLSFPGWTRGAPVPADVPLLLGDVVLAFETIEREAQQQNKALADHFVHLIVHGVLHLLGYDHASEMDAAEMETLETSILAALGVADPYRNTI